MIRRLHILIVSQNVAGGRAARSRLRAAGYEATLRNSFPTGCGYLRRAPDLVFADVMLGAFNGLHLAMRAQWAGIPSVVFGPNDPVLQKEAQAIGTSYVTSGVEAQALMTLVETLASMQLPRFVRPAGVSPTDVSARPGAASEATRGYLTH